MPPKKKEDKKQEEVADNSSLPKCKSWIFSIYWHPYLTLFHKYFKSPEFRVISKDDLANYLKEKSIEKNSENLAKALKTKIDEIELPIRKEKKEGTKPLQESPKKATPSPTPRIFDENKYDLFIYLKNFPSTKEEVTEINKLGIFMDLCYYVKPTRSHIESKWQAKLNLYKEKIQEIKKSGNRESLLASPNQPEDYPEAFQEIQNIH